MMKRIAVIGAGFMGFQISLQSAVHGHTVAVQDISDESLNRAKEQIDHEIQTRIESGSLTSAEADKILALITFTSDLSEAVSSADIIIEAAFEDITLKSELIRKISELCPEESLITTNSSSIRISQIETEMINPSRAANMHFYPPVWQRSFVEIMRGTETTEETVEKAVAFARSVGLTPLKVAKESTGFIFNRIWRAIKKECLEIVDQGIASHDDVDRSWILGFGTPVGPCALMDMVGLDVVKDIEEVYHNESGADRDRIPKLLTDMIGEGRLGIKSEHGFYDYPNPSYSKDGWLKGK